MTIFKPFTVIQEGKWQKEYLSLRNSNVTWEEFKKQKVKDWYRQQYIEQNR